MAPSGDRKPAFSWAQVARGNLRCEKEFPKPKATNNKKSEGEVKETMAVPAAGIPVMPLTPALGDGNPIATSPASPGRVDNVWEKRARKAVADKKVVPSTIFPEGSFPELQPKSLVGPFSPPKSQAASNVGDGQASSISDGKTSSIGGGKVSSPIPSKPSSPTKKPLNPETPAFEPALKPFSAYPAICQPEASCNIYKAAGKAGTEAEAEAEGKGKGKDDGSNGAYPGSNLFATAVKSISKGAGSTQETMAPEKAEPRNTWAQYVATKMENEFFLALIQDDEVHRHYRLDSERMKKMFAAHDRGDINLWYDQTGWDVIIICFGHGRPLGWRLHREILCRASLYFQKWLPPPGQPGDHIVVRCHTHQPTQLIPALWYLYHGTYPPPAHEDPRVAMEDPLSGIRIARHTDMYISGSSIALRSMMRFAADGIRAVGQRLDSVRVYPADQRVRVFQNYLRLSLNMLLHELVFVEEGTRHPRLMDDLQHALEELLENAIVHVGVSPELRLWKTQLTQGQTAAGPAEAQGTAGPGGDGTAQENAQDGKDGKDAEDDKDKKSED